MVHDSLPLVLLLPDAVFRPSPSPTEEEGADLYGRKGSECARLHKTVQDYLNAAGCTVSCEWPWGVDTVYTQIV